MTLRWSETKNRNFFSSLFDRVSSDKSNEPCPAFVRCSLPRKNMPQRLSSYDVIIQRYFPNQEYFWSAIENRNLLASHTCVFRATISGGKFARSKFVFTHPHPVVVLYSLHFTFSQVTAAAVIGIIKMETFEQAVMEATG